MKPFLILYLVCTSFQLHATERSCASYMREFIYTSKLSLLTNPLRPDNLPPHLERIKSHSIDQIDLLMMRISFSVSMSDPIEVGYVELKDINNVVLANSGIILGEIKHVEHLYSMAWHLLAVNREKLNKVSTIKLRRTHPQDYTGSVADYSYTRREVLSDHKFNSRIGLNPLYKNMRLESSIVFMKSNSFIWYEDVAPQNIMTKGYRAPFHSDNLPFDVQRISPALADDVDLKMMKNSFYFSMRDPIEVGYIELLDRNGKVIATSGIMLGEIHHIDRLNRMTSVLLKMNKKQIDNVARVRIRHTHPQDYTENLIDYAFSENDKIADKKLRSFLKNNPSYRHIELESSIVFMKDNNFGTQEDIKMENIRSRGYLVP